MVTGVYTIPAVWIQDRERGAEVEVEITFDFSPAEPAVLHGDAPYPGCPARVSFVSAKANILTGDAFDDMRQAWLDAWAEGWLEDNESDALDLAYGHLFAEEDAREEARNNGQFGMGA